MFTYFVFLFLLLRAYKQKRTCQLNILGFLFETQNAKYYRFLIIRIVAEKFLYNISQNIEILNASRGYLTDLVLMGIELSGASEYR